MEGFESKKRIWYEVPSTECANTPVNLCMTCKGIPPTALATTGFFFHRASVTVNPNPSRSDFWMMIVEARCRALISSALHEEFREKRPPPLVAIYRGAFGFDLVALVGGLGRFEGGLRGLQCGLGLADAGLQFFLIELG